MIKTTKTQIILNVASNYFIIGYNLIVGVIMAPFLIKKLGIEMYGIISLVNTIPSYILVFTTGLSNSATRFMAIAMQDKDLDETNMYFYSSYKFLKILILFLFPIVIVISLLGPKVFNVPLSSYRDTQVLIFFILISTLLNIIQAPFVSIYQICNRFLEKNLIIIISKFCSIGIFAILFWKLTPKVWYVGIYQISISIISVILFLKNYNKFQDIFNLESKNFSQVALRKIGKLAFWNSTNDIASLFFLLISQLLINQCLGVEESGYFAPVLLLTSLLMMGSGAISNVLMPFIYRDISGKVADVDLESKLLFYSKLLAFILAFPVFTMVVNSTYIVELWLGKEFVKISFAIQCFLLSLFFGGIIFMPYAHFYRGLNKIKIPAIFNLIFSVINVVLIILGFKLDMGINGVAYSFCLTFGIRGVIFNVSYISFLSNNRIIFERIFSMIIRLVMIIFVFTLINQLHMPLVWKTILSFIFFCSFILVLGFTSSEKTLISKLIGI